MKCPNCGAEINTDVCEYCGSQITAEMQKEQEHLHKARCPKCGSSNISFEREKQGEFSDKNSKTVIHRTVGVCKDCGYTWFANGESVPKERKTWLWVLGWIFIFPLPLTLILVKKKDMNNILKYAIIAVAWIVYLLIGFAGSGDTKTTAPAGDTTTTQVTQSTTESATKSTAKKETTTRKTAKKETATTASASLGEINALQKAKQYLALSGFSEKGLRDQLNFEGFTSSEIDYAIKHCGADWKKECAENAKNYLDTGGFSEKGLREQLNYEGFTSSEIDSAIKHCGADWNKECVEKAKSYLDMGGFSKQSLSEQLDFEGFSSEQINYALKEVGY